MPDRDGDMTDRIHSDRDRGLQDSVLKGSEYKIQGSQGRMRHGSPIFYNLLEEMAATHDKKSHDYASNDNPYGNYYFAGQLSLLFNASPKDAGFVGRLGEKLYRLANLESSGKTPLNEGVEDTERDICIIVALWIASRRQRRLDGST